MSLLSKQEPVPSAPFRFLDLPGEIRNYIYDLVLVEHGPIAIYACCTRLHDPPAITQVSRRLRGETLSLFYQKNRFRFEIFSPEEPNTFAIWINSLSLENIRNLRNVEIAFDNTYALDVSIRCSGTFPKGHVRLELHVHGSSMVERPTQIIRARLRKALGMGDDGRLEFVAEDVVDLVKKLYVLNRRPWYVLDAL